MIFTTKIYSCFTKKFLCICVYFFPEKTLVQQQITKKRRQHNQKRDFLVENTYQDHFSFPGVAAAPLHLNTWREKKGSVPLVYMKSHIFLRSHNKPEN